VALTSTLAIPALQQPDWPDPAALRRVCDRLAASPAPVDAAACRTLADDIARAASGRSFVLVGGDCAEQLDDATPERIVAKAEHLHRTADAISAAGLPVTRIGRLGGQFAKPRSQAYEETSDGRLVPSYRGDAVNGLDEDERRPDPTRLLAAHTATLGAASALRRWDHDRRVAAMAERRPAPGRTWLSHEALLLDYETALVRDGGRHAASGHYLWIGDRTRQPGHGHIAFAAAVDNPVGVKLGPHAAPDEVRAVVEALDPARRHRPGRLSLVARMGAARCTTALPGLIEALGPRAGDVAWFVDPMHGNGRTNLHGQKTRLMSEITLEVAAFFTVLGHYGLFPAGIHLEMTPDHVTECVDGPGDLARRLPDYRSACDPRLDPAQAAEVADLVAALLPSQPAP
jgi:3-deoxy-7-phosphoheptulonate synthase